MQYYAPDIENDSNNFYFQSKSKGLSMACYDLVGTGNLQLIIGWKSGKVSKQQITKIQNFERTFITN